LSYGLRVPRSRYPKTITQSREDFLNEMRYKSIFFVLTPLELPESTIHIVQNISSYLQL